MPKISTNKDGGSIVYDQDDWLSGADTTSAGSDYGKMGGNPLMAQVDPLRKYAYVSPFFNPTNVTNVAQVTSFLRNGVVSGDNAYIISNGALVQKLGSLAAGTISTTAPFPHTIVHGAHTNVSGNDAVIYYSSTTQRVFYSFSDDTDWDVGIYNVVADTFDDDFMSTIPASPLAAPYLTGGKGYPHPLVVGDDDVLYIGDRNFVHAYDGATNTFFPAVLTLPQGYVVSCFVTTQDINLAIGTYLVTSQGSSTFNRGKAKVWIWNYLALDPDYSRDLRDNYVSELIQWAGTIAAFSSGRKTLSDAGTNKLQVLNGTEFEVVKTWSTGGLPIRGGVDTVGNDLYWNASGVIYSYTKRPDTGNYILNYLYGNGVGTSGMLRFFTSLFNIHSSSGTTTDGGLQYFVSNYAPAGSLQPQVAVPPFNTLQRGRLKSVTICFATAVSGGRSFRLNTALDRDAQITLADLTTVTNTRKIVIKNRDDGSPLGDFSTLQPQLVWQDGLGATACPVVEYIRYDYENINADNY
jgi:hypothetical protein